MNAILSKLKGDKVIWIVVFLLSMISLLAVFSGAGSPMLRKHGTPEYHLIKHGALLLLGFLVMYFVHKLDYRIFARISNLLLYITVPLLAYTLIFGVKVNDAARWISIFGQSFQPSDLAKVTLVVYLAKILTQKQNVIEDFKEGFLPVITVVFVICMLVGPANLSTAGVIFSTSLMIMFIAGARWQYLAGLIGVGIFAVLILFAFSHRATTWNSRWQAYKASWSDNEFDPPYQMVQAYGAISGGSVLGKGIGKSTLRNYLPNPTSDMVWPIILEEMGFVGGMTVMILYIVLLFRCVAIATVSKTFGALLAAGLAFLLCWQAMLNMAVAVGVLPVTGLPLPMVSQGGTSILFTGLALGIILSVSRHALEGNLNEEATA